MDIIIYNINKTVLTVTIDDNCTVEQLKDKIMDKHKILVKKLIIRGKNLVDDYVLLERYDLKNDHMWYTV